MTMGNKMIKLDYIAYNENYRTYDYETIYVNADEIACVQDRTSSVLPQPCCLLWLKGQDEAFNIRGLARDVIQKMHEQQAQEEE